MNDSLTESVARLHRAGSEDSHQTQKLRNAVDNLLTWMIQNLPTGFTLPYDCTLYPNGNFVRVELTNAPFDTSFRTVFNISIGKEYSREELFHFSELIANGFFKKLIDKLATESAEFEKTVEQTESFLETVAPTPLLLHFSSYWSDLEQLARERKLPRDLVDCLMALINSHNHNTIGPEAKPHLIGEAKKYLQGGILLIRINEEMFYDVMVFVPNKNQEVTKRFFFKLMPKCKGGQFRHLKEL